MKKVNYQLITLAREIEGYTQKDFSSAIDVEQGTLSKVENGLLDKSAYDIVKKASYVLGYPEDFFFQEWILNRVEGHYRRKLSEPVKILKECKAKMTLAEHHFNILTEHIELPAVNFPIWDLEEDGSVMLCAKFVRDFWKIPKGRISNLTEILESNGFVIIELDMPVDGFSVMSDFNVPLIFVKKNLPGDRYRMTIAHEAFHFPLHKGRKISEERNLEKEVFQGASEFLMPLQEIESQISQLSISKLIDLKSYYKVSMQAILYKASKSELITANQAKYLWMQMSSARYKKKEPVDIQKEQPIIIKEIIETHLNDFKYSVSDLNKILNFGKVDEWYINTSSRKLKVLRKVD